MPTLPQIEFTDSESNVVNGYILSGWKNEHPGVWNVGIASYDRNGEYLGYKLSSYVVELN